MGDARWVWVGGEEKPVRSGEARIAATDHAYLFGSGLYEVLRTYHARPFALDDHLRRLASGAARLGWSELPLATMERAVREMARLRSPEESYLRLAVSRGLQFPGWGEEPAGPPRWCAYAGPPHPYVSAVHERGVRCVFASRPRWNPGGFIPAVKFAGNHDLVLARHEAEAAGAFEALLRSSDGAFAEGASSTVFLVRDKKVITPGLDAGILDGVTRARVLHLCQQAGVAAEERRVEPEELFDAEEVFLASTTKEIAPVVEIAGRAIGTGVPGLIADRLLGLYQESALESTNS